MIHTSTSPKNENTQILRFRYISSDPAVVFLSVVKGFVVSTSTATYQEFTPTSNIALLILYSQQAIVPLCRPGGVRAARFNKTLLLTVFKYAAISDEVDSEVRCA